MKLNRIWHCPRPTLAASYLALLGLGLVVSTSIFAPRRTGKTVFLRQDLTPAAVAGGYLVAYADLWQTRLNPGMALIRALEEALEPRTAAGKALGCLQQPVRKLKAQAGVAGVKAELELAGARKEATDMALRIEELVARLVAKKPLLLLVDEAQALARTRDNELMAMALRTAMTKHRDRIRVVFTGSSRSQLAHVFSNADAPLYAVGATIHDFPLLGRELVEFVAQRFEQACGRTLDVAQAWVEFKAFAQQPEPFLSAIVAMLMDPSLTLEAACAAERAEQDREENHEGTWAALDPLQRHLVLRIAEDPLLKPFSRSTLASAAAALGLQGLEATNVQYALRGLGARNIVSKSPRGVFTFDNAAFERWVRTLAPRPASAS
jgi:hypothetical protein